MLNLSSIQLRRIERRLPKGALVLSAEESDRKNPFNTFSKRARVTFLNGERIEVRHVGYEYQTHVVVQKTEPLPPKKKLEMIHFQRGGKIPCGRSRYWNTIVSENLKEVTCRVCRKANKKE